MDIGTKIRKLREDKKMSQNELALELGISQTTLHNIETGNPCIFRSKPSHCPQCFCQLGCMVFMHFLCKIVQKQHFFST